MFGYLKPYGIGSSSVNRLYKKYYCSLCHALWINYGFFSRFLLSYDLTFVCALLGLDTAEPTTPKLKCYRKMKIESDCDSWKSMAALSLLMVSEKMNDDINDENSIKAKLVSFLYKRHFSKVKKDYPQASRTIIDSFKAFNIKEKEHAGLSELSEAFADIMSNAVKSMLDCSEHELAVIRFVSKWVYFIDAVDDLDEDIKCGRFNPFSTIAHSKEQLLSINSCYIQNFANSLTFEMKPYIKNFDLSIGNDKLIATILVKSMPYVSYCIFTDTSAEKRTLAMKLSERHGVYYV